MTFYKYLNYTPVKLLLFIVVIFISLAGTRKLDVYIINCDIGDMFVKKEYEKRYTQEELYSGLKDFSLDGNVITSTSNDPWVLLDTSGVGGFKYIKLNIEILGINEIAAQFFYHFVDMEDYFTEEESLMRQIKSGVNYVRLLYREYSALRLDLASEEGISFRVNSVELTNKYFPAISDLILLVLLNAVWCGTWFLLLFKYKYIKSFINYTQSIPDLIINHCILHKVRIFLSILSLIGILIGFYCVLSIVTSETIGLPFQHQITFDRVSSYKNLTDFGIHGDAIFSESDQGIVNLSVGENTYGKFKYATIFVSRLSDINSNASIQYRTKNNSYLMGDITYFRLKEGRNVVKIPYGEWAVLKLRLGDREDMSMIIDRIILSRFPVLVDYFLPVFIFLVFIICVIWYYIVFHRLGAWLIAHPFMILSVILLLQVFTMVYYVNLKKGYFLDEMLSHSQANGRRGINVIPDFYNNWNPSDYYWGLLTVQPDERFDFKSVYQLLVSNVHPPFYHLQLHAVHSLFPNFWSNWFGAGINIFWLVSANIILYLASRLIFKDKISALLPSAIWGFSSGAISSAVFFRMYATLTFFFTALAYLGILIISGKTKTGTKFLTGLFLVIFLGCFTQLYFFVFLAFTAFILFIFLLFTKEYKKIVKLTITVSGSLGFYYLCWPVIISQLFNSSRGEEAFENFKSSEPFFFNLKSYVDIINRELFSKMLPVNLLSKRLLFLLLIALLVLLIIFVCRKGIKKIFGREIFTILFLFSISTLFVTIVARIAPYRDDRYVFAVYPIIILTLITLLYNLFSVIKGIKPQFLLTLFSLFLILTGFHNKEVNYLYSNTPNIYRILKDYNNVSCISLIGHSQPGRRISQMLYDFAQFNRVFVCKSTDDNDTRLKEFGTALNNITRGQELVLYIDDRLNKEETFEELNSVLPYQRVQRIYRTYNGIDAYRIEW